MSSDEPAFHTIAIAGLGLIGGSIALGVRERWPSIRIVGVDRPAVLAHALGSGAIDRGATSIADIGTPDLVVLAAPIAQNIALLRQLGAQFDDPVVGRGTPPQGGSGERSGAAAARARDRAGAASDQPIIITDVGGTKRDIVEAGRDLPGEVVLVPGHPIGGAERGGFAFARPDLFSGRPWIFTPAPETNPAIIARLEEFAVGLGARPARLEPADHDRLMAYVSHLPQLAASALMSTVGCGAADGLRLAGRGLVDTTRLASSPASVWRDVAASNHDFIGEALDRLIAVLTDVRRDLQQGEMLEQVFEDAERWRAKLMKGRD